jgi:hypothetical protein
MTFGKKTYSSEDFVRDRCEEYKISPAVPACLWISSKSAHLAARPLICLSHSSFHSCFTPQCCMPLDCCPDYAYTTLASNFCCFQNAVVGALYQASQTDTTGPPTAAPPTAFSCSRWAPVGGLHCTSRGLWCSRAPMPAPTSNGTFPSFQDNDFKSLSLGQTPFEFQNQWGSRGPSWT